MKRLLLLILLVITLVACGTKTDTSSNTSTDNDQPYGPASFIATIIEIKEDIGSDTYVAFVSVSDPEDSALKKGQQLWINLAIASEENFEVNDKVRVGFDGSIMESDPVQIITDTVEKISQ